jgi:hypothetical protein
MLCTPTTSEISCSVISVVFASLRISRAFSNSADLLALIDGCSAELPSGPCSDASERSAIIGCRAIARSGVANVLNYFRFRQHSGHGRHYCWLDPVANDLDRTSLKKRAVLNHLRRRRRAAIPPRKR